MKTTRCRYFPSEGFRQALLHPLFGALLLAAPFPVSAGGQLTDCSEHALLTAIAGGGTVTFPTNCTITLTTPVVIGAGSTTIDSSGYNVTISGGNNVQLFVVGGDLHLIGLTLLNGSSSSGGALYVDPGATVTATNCTFSGNSATGAAGSAGAAGADKDYGFGGDGENGSSGTPGLGGAIYNLGVVTLLNCHLSTNTAVGGAGGAGGNGGSVGGTIGQGGNGGNGGSGGMGAGGAVYNLGTVVLTNCTLTGNSVAGGNGGTGGTGGSSRTVSTNGTGIFPGLDGSGGAGATGLGGAVYNGLTAVVTACTFSSDTAQGGGSAAGGSQVNGVGTTGAAGADASGGAVCNVMAGALTNCTFFSNVVAGGTGGNGGSGTGTLSTQGDGGNGGNGNGGSVFNSGTLSVVNCTLSSGAAIGGTNGVAGSGFFNGSSGNPGAPRGGNIAGVGGNLVLRNSIIANNISGSNGYGNITDGGFNISSDFSISFSAAGSSMGTAPKLGPLAKNGGLTSTMALLSGSPAIDKIGIHSFFPPTDQRGVSRPSGLAADIGAYEAGSTNVLSILQPTLSSNRISVVVPSQAGLAYVLQYKNTLSDSAWTSLSTKSGTGGLLTNQDFTTNQPGRFYRVLVQ